MKTATNFKTGQGGAVALSGVLGICLLLIGCSSSVSVGPAKFNCDDSTSKLRADFVLRCSENGNSANGKNSDLNECITASERIFCKHTGA